MLARHKQYKRSVKSYLVEDLTENGTGTYTQPLFHVTYIHDMILTSHLRFDDR